MLCAWEASALECVLCTTIGGSTQLTCVRYGSDALSVELSGAQVLKRSEVRVDDAFCVFELLEDEPMFKQSMQSSVAIRFLSRPSGTEAAKPELAGTAVFSLNFLYFSQEQFCCSERTCGTTFSSEHECETHWDAVHRGMAVDGQPQHSGHAHLFKSCSIDLPVTKVRSDGVVVFGAATSTTRMGTVRIVAYAEDLGRLTDEAVALIDKRCVGEGRGWCWLSILHDWLYGLTTG